MVQTISRQTVFLVVLVALSFCLPLASRAQSIDRTDSAKSSPAEDEDDGTDTSESPNSGKGTTPGTDSSNAPVVDSGKGTTPGTDSPNASVIDPVKLQSLLEGLTAFKKLLDEAKAKGIGVASYASQCQRLEERIRSGESSDDLKASLDALNRGLKEQIQHVSPSAPPQPEAGRGETKGPSKSSSKYKAIVLCMVQGERQEALVTNLAHWFAELVKQGKVPKNTVALVPLAMSGGIIRATSNASENAILARVGRKLNTGDYFFSLAPQFAVCDKDWNLKLATSNVKQIPYFVVELVKQTGTPQKK